MKKLICLFVLFTHSALAQGLTDGRNLPPAKPNQLPSIHNIQVEQKPVFGGFFFKPMLSIEYHAPRISSSGVNSEFKVSGTLFHQIGDLQNIAIGGNFRVHKYLGLNANWVQSDMTNSSLQGLAALSNRAQFRFDQYNLSALFYVPVIENFFEIFAEGGLADMRSQLTYNDVRNTSHETVGLYGAGFQFIFNEKDALRLSWQRYAGRIGLINSEYSAMRIGYLRAF